MKKPIALAALALLAPLTGCASTASSEQHEAVASTAEAATATLFAWNSCVDDNDVCWEQWGSYPLACTEQWGNSVDVDWHPGVRCSSVCDADGSGEGLCLGGCYGQYDALLSVALATSAYTCEVPEPTAWDVKVHFKQKAGAWYADGSYKISNGTTEGEDVTSQHAFYGATDVNGSNTVQLQPANGLVAATSPYIKFCVTPTMEGTVDELGDTADATGAEACSAWTTSSDTISASNVTLTIDGDKASGGYTYNDADGYTDQSTYYIQRADDANGTNATTIITSNNWLLMSYDDQKYLQFCVTPANAVFTGATACSGWVAVGPTMTLYQDMNQGGSQVTFALDSIGAGTCVELGDYGFNDTVTSLTVNAQPSATTVAAMYGDAGCSGTLSTYWAGAGQVGGSSNVGSSVNDTFSSFRVVWNDGPTATNVSLSISGTSATGSYTYGDGLGIPSSNTSYTIQRADDAAGTNATTITTNAVWGLWTNDNNKYLRFCVTPGDGIDTGATVCSSGWAPVGPTVQLWKDADYGSSNRIYAYQRSANGSCFDLASTGFGGVVSSLKFFAGSTGDATLWVYKGANCTSTSATYTLPANGEEDSSYVDNTYGSGWNDAIQSFKVTWE